MSVEKKIQFISKSVKHKTHHTVSFIGQFKDAVTCQDVMDSVQSYENHVFISYKHHCN